VTEPGRQGLKLGHWVLIGAVILVLLGLVFVVMNRGDGQDPKAEPSNPTASATASSAPACAPTLAEIGYTRDGGRIDFGLIMTSDCSQAAVNNIVEIAAVAADGTTITPSGFLQPALPVILPGQRLGVAGTLLVDRSAKVARLEATVKGSRALPVTEFATWAKTVTVVDLKHTGPDSRGLSTVTGTVRTDPPTVNLCNPHFALILRDRNNKIIYGLTATADEPSFEEHFPPATDYRAAQVYVVQGVESLGMNSAATTSCRTQ